jgi:DNA-binding transcriptional regulator YhcF (GntR family)
MPIQKKSNLLSAPVHSKLVDDILSGITDGTLKEGDRLASESMLKEQYGISIKSIKRGLGILVEKGILTRTRGRGTFVSDINAAHPQPLVRRDTVAIANSWEYFRYHPFFTEQNKGILAGLAEHGWKTLILPQSKTDQSKVRPLIFHYITPATLELELSEHAEVAGIICLNLSDKGDQILANNDHLVVSTGAGDNFSYAYYDWPAEIERLFKITISKGARRIGVISSQPKETLAAMFERSILSENLTEDDVIPTYMLCEASNHGTELTNQAFQIALKAFEKETPFDALIITDDYETTGVVDALVSMPHKNWEKMSITALLSKESKLPAQIPMTALIADGYACGIAIADLMNEQIASGNNSKKSIIMSCNLVEWK